MSRGSHALAGLILVAVLVAAAALGWWRHTRIVVETMRHPGFDVEAFLRAHCFPRMRATPPRGDTGDAWWCVARRAGRVVGCAALSDKRSHFLLHFDCVHPQHRRRGVGERLHRARLALCRARDAVRPVRLHIREGNAAAEALLRKFPAFRRVRRAKLTDTSDPHAWYVLYQAPGGAY